MPLENVWAKGRTVALRDGSALEVPSAPSVSAAMRSGEP